MLNGHEISIFFGALVALGCGGNAVDLGHGENRGWADAPAAGSSATAPQTIYQSEEAIVGFALDDDTLYALVTHGETFELVSCRLERCRSERTILFSGSWLDQPSPLSTPLVLSGGWLYWIVGNGGRDGIAACPTTGCGQPSLVPTLVRGGVTGDGEGGAYWFDREGALMRIAANSPAAERVRDCAGEIGEPSSGVARGDYLYFSDVSSVRRIRKDGTRAPELLATDDMIFGLGLAADAVYYASQVLTGRIVQCPVDGCTTGGRTLAANQRWPEGVQINGTEAFWLNNQRFSQAPTNATLSHATLRSCALPDCAAVNDRVSDLLLDGVIRYENAGPKFAVSSRAIVWLEQFHGIGTSLRRLTR